MSVNVVGTVELSPAEIRKMQTWRDRNLADIARPNARSRQYIAPPPVKWAVNERNGAKRYRRFSCVGLVLECYAYVDIKLIDLDENNLPDVPLVQLVHAYPLAAVPENRKQMGLEEPYKVVLPGYLFHAFTRASDVIRGSDDGYRPQQGDEVFTLEHSSDVDSLE